MAPFMYFVHKYVISFIGPVSKIDKLHCSLQWVKGFTCTYLTFIFTNIPSTNLSLEDEVAQSTDHEDYAVDLNDPDDDDRDSVCHICKANYDDDEQQEALIGCDNDECGRWFHFWCAGFKRKPTARKAFVCPYCK